MADSKALKQIERDYKKLKKKLPRVVGQVAVNFSKDNFRRQGFLNGGAVQKWKNRKYGSSSRAILTGKRGGNLRRSIGVISANANSITIGTRGVKYGQIHNEGGTIRQTVTAKQRRFFWAKYKATGNEMYKRMAMSSKLEIRIPQRQFMGNSTDLDKDISDTIEEQLKKIFN